MCFETASRRIRTCCTH